MAGKAGILLAVAAGAVALAAISKRSGGAVAASVPVWLTLADVRVPAPPVGVSVHLVDTRGNAQVPVTVRIDSVGPDGVYAGAIMAVAGSTDPRTWAGRMPPEVYFTDINIVSLADPPGIVANAPHGGS